MLKYFRPDNNWQFNSRIKKGNNPWFAIAEGYRSGAKLIEKHILETDRKEQDFLIYPYCFQIRHYVEIRLKEIITESCKVSPHSIKLPKHHDVSELWKEAHAALKETGEIFDPPKNVERFIKELQSVDIKSDSFRYPMDKSGSDTLSRVDMINVERLAQIFNETIFYLDGITDGLAVAIDEQNQS